MSKVPGADILAEILNGNEKVLSKVYKKVHHHLLNYGRAINATDQNVKEAVQDAFEIFYRQLIDKKLILTCTVDTYIISIAKRVLLKDEHNMSSLKKEPIINDDLIDELDTTRSIDEQRHALYIEEFKKLGEDCKRILTLTLEGYKASEIKTLMQYASDEFVRLKRQRCKNYLTNKIKENPDYEKLRDGKTEDL